MSMLRVVCFLLATHCAYGSSLPSSFVRGMTYGAYSPDVLSSSATLEHELPAMSKHGITWISTVVTWTQQNLTATAITRSPSTATDASLVSFIEHAHALRMSVLVKPHVDVDTGLPRALIEPSDVEEWFESYSAMMMLYARLAEVNGAEALCVGTELSLLSTLHPRKWRALVTSLRSVFGGELTYASIWEVEYKTVQWWDALDWIGIDAYFSLASPLQPAASVEHMTNRWREHLNALWQWRNERSLQNVSIVFTEVGYTSTPACGVWPASYPRSLCDQSSFSTTNMTAQANAYTSLFQALQNRTQNPVDGVFMWWWDNESTSDYVVRGASGQWACYYTPRAKPAGEVLSAYFGGSA